MPSSVLVLGPLLRYVDTTSAAVWVEVAERGVVTVHADGREHEAHTFTVHGHHYALVDVSGLRPGGSYPYTVRVGGREVWPSPRSAYPRPRIRTLQPGRPLGLLFGSCRTSVPHDKATNLRQGPDVLRATALRMATADPAGWPDLMLLLGDQVYADDTSAEMRTLIAARRDLDAPPGRELKDFGEYADLYRLAWTDPANRWLLSTVPTAMMFDDHDIRDDWNTSAAWRRRMRATSWWHDRVVGGLAAYWVYQHIGNLSAAERAADPLWRDVVSAGRDGDAGARLDAFAAEADADPSAYRWSFCRDLDGTRLLMLDTRAARVLDEGARRMLDEPEMAWLDGLLTGGHDHLLVGTSLPFLLPSGLHDLEAWNEALCAGAWGRRVAGWSERLRQGVDLEHWAAFQASFHRVARAVLEVADGRRGDPPATVCFLSGDVHHSYLAEVDRDTRPEVDRDGGSEVDRDGGTEVGARPEVGRGVGRGAGRGLPDASACRLVQAVCSPIRNPLPRPLRFASASSATRLAAPLRLLGRSARVPDPPLRWSVTEGPWFDNAVATLTLDGRRARIRWETAVARGGRVPALVPLHEVVLR